MTALRAKGVAVTLFAVAGEPTVEDARAGVRAVAEAGAEAVIAFGGGSALDAGKAIAALATNGGDPLQHLEVVGAGRPLDHASLPFIAIPTTAGTGSEVTRNAVLAVPEARVKASLRGATMLPRLAIVDPDLLAPLPPAVIARAASTRCHRSSSRSCRPAPTRSRTPWRARRSAGRRPRCGGPSRRAAGERRCHRPGARGPGVHQRLRWAVPGQRRPGGRPRVRRASRRHVRRRPRRPARRSCPP